MKTPEIPPSNELSMLAGGEQHEEPLLVSCIFKPDCPSVCMYQPKSVNLMHYAAPIQIQGHILFELKAVLE